MKRINVPNLTPKQLQVYRAIHNVRMAWVALIVVLVLFVASLTGFFVALFRPDIAGGSKILAGVIESILTGCLFQVYKHLFPTQNCPHCPKN